MPTGLRACTCTLAQLRATWAREISGNWIDKLCITASISLRACDQRVTPTAQIACATLAASLATALFAFGVLTPFATYASTLTAGAALAFECVLCFRVPAR